MKPLELGKGNCTSVISGASTGIGAAVAIELARRGSNISIFARNGKGLEATAEKARSYGVSVDAESIDITDSAAIARFADKLGEKYEGVQVLVNNAGASLIGNFRQISLEEFKWLMDINLWGTIVTTKTFLPLLEKAPSAHIANISSTWGLAAPAGKAPYSTSKFGVRGFSEAIRHEFEGGSVSVGIIFPGGIKTDITLNARVAKNVDPEMASRAAKLLTARYKTSPEDAAVKIVDSIVNRKGRLIVGSGARSIDILARLFPETYWRYLGGSLKGVTSTEKRQAPPGP
jgi:short-subunit dehydrogenase